MLMFSSYLIYPVTFCITSMTNTKNKAGAWIQMMIWMNDHGSIGLKMSHSVSLIGTKHLKCGAFTSICVYLPSDQLILYYIEVYMNECELYKLYIFFYFGP